MQSIAMNQSQAPTWWDNLNSDTADLSAEALSSPLRYADRVHESSKSPCLVQLHCEPNVYKCRQASTSSVLAARFLSRQHLRLMASMERIKVTSPSKQQPAAGSKSGSLTIKHLRPYFEQPIVLVAETFGISVTLLKKRCRQLGIARWPHRQITGLRKSIESLEHAASHLNEEQRQTYKKQLDKLKWKLILLLHDPRGKEERIGRDVSTDTTPTPDSKNSPQKKDSPVKEDAAQAHRVTLPRLEYLTNPVSSISRNSLPSLPPLGLTQCTIEATRSMLPPINTLLFSNDRL
uniref:RWPRK domaincontaining protein putative n=1 Tax=Albugo laibachii Nc14 TaxID=890382 RepID=F0WC26_9STRA|nr:RWPRK domaincontaining protein putative [Albugo laibachii Nc14]|eukprot:CCA18707.1 RWPRK domaincontaining protein putative [Albugo laibachii Nc14]